MLQPPGCAIVSDNVGAEVIRRTSSRAQTVSLSLLAPQRHDAVAYVSLLVACD